MGGRGGSSGTRSRANGRTGQTGSGIFVTSEQLKNDYTDGGNSALIKWQNQTEDKSANFLAKVDNETDLAQIAQQTNDPWGFYDNPMQKFIEVMGLNKPTRVLSESAFNAYVKATGATVLYRGWSGQNAIDRFMNSPNSHIGTGINGDGYYFAPDRATARSYGSAGTKSALSPEARVVSLDKVNAEIARRNAKLQSALRKAGSRGSRSYGSNEGQAQMALKMGYNVIDAGWAVIPLVREAVVTSSKRAW